MTTILQLNQIRKLLLGQKVDRATANLPQTAQSPIFNVVGGRILLTSLVGEVTAAVQAQATTVQLIATPSSGTAVNLTNSTGDVNGKEVGATVVLPTTVGGTAVVANAGANLLTVSGLFLLRTGTLDFKTGASSTGQMKWSLTYVPLDDGASVTAA